MRRLNKHFDQLRDKAIAEAVKATDRANANVKDAAAQDAANKAVGAARVARQVADHHRYNRSTL